MTTLQFHEDFYSKRALTRTVEAFAEVARFGLERQTPYWQVTLQAMLDGDESQQSLQDVLGAFQNFALATAIREQQP